MPPKSASNSADNRLPPVPATLRRSDAVINRRHVHIQRTPHRIWSIRIGGLSAPQESSPSQRTSPAPAHPFAIFSRHDRERRTPHVPGSALTLPSVVVLNNLPVSIHLHVIPLESLYHPQENNAAYRVRVTTSETIPAMLPNLRPSVPPLLLSLPPIQAAIVFLALSVSLFRNNVDWC